MTKFKLLSAALIATGKVAAHMDWDRSPEENVKRLGGVLYQGDLMLSIDNVDQPIGGSYLNSILTQPVVQVRILGLTGQHHLPTSLLVCASGNNLNTHLTYLNRYQNAAATFVLGRIGG